MHPNSLRGPAMCRTISRRAFIASAGALVVVGCGTTRLQAPKERFLNLTRVQSRETLTLTYYANGEYDAAALDKINVFMRDPWNDRTTDMDRNLLDMVHEVHMRLGHDGPIDMLSAYRSPESNASLAVRNRKVARNSFHIYGKAIDLRLPDKDLESLIAAAQKLHRGGLGIYRRSRSRHVHLDTGPQRIWYG